jgi:two-component system sensor histidine kinase UhpB
MSLHRQLLLSALAILFGSCLIGALAIYVHARSKVQLEMDASMAVSEQFVDRSVADLSGEPDPRHRLVQIVTAFDGDRHTAVTFLSPKGVVIARSNVRQPGDAAPTWFLRLVDTPRLAIRHVLPGQLSALGSIVLEPFPDNEVSEAWSDGRLTFEIVAVFFVFVLMMIVALQRRAFRPFLDLRNALVKFGAGQYDTRVSSAAYIEIQPVLSQFNTMAEQLAQFERQKHQLEQQMQRIQEDEAAALARDLHDEIAPFLVAVETDAALIQHSLAEGIADKIGAFAGSIVASVAHMKRHIREILERLKNSTLAELGLRSGIEALADFWQQRRPDIVFDLEIADMDIPERSAHLAFRIVQEAITNAIRHGSPNCVQVSVYAVDAELHVKVADDGKGFNVANRSNGFGIAGMTERAKSSGGSLRIEPRPGGGTCVSANLPYREVEQA